MISLSSIKQSFFEQSTLSRWTAGENSISKIALMALSFVFACFALYYYYYSFTARKKEIITTSKDIPEMSEEAKRDHIMKLLLTKVANDQGLDFSSN